jgi:hypothetical protein
MWFGFRLTISHVKAWDSAIYQCIVGSADLGFVSSAARLTVKSFPPRFHTNLFPQRVFVVEGARLVLPTTSLTPLYTNASDIQRLPCLYQAMPKGSAEWRRLDGRTVGSLVEPDEPSVMVLEAAQPSDSAKYECRAWNELGEARAVVEIVVISESLLSL